MHIEFKFGFAVAGLDLEEGPTSGKKKRGC